MEESGQRENGRHKDQYKSLHTQWMIPPHLMKDQHALTMKFMSILAERDAAIQERNLAFSEKKAALTERDLAVLQRDTAIAERNNALVERDNAMAALEYRDNATVSGCATPSCPPGCNIPRGTKHTHHAQSLHHPSHMTDSPYNSRDYINDAFPISTAVTESPKPRRAKRPKEPKPFLTRKTTRPSKRGKKGVEDMNKQVTVAKPSDWKGGPSMGLSNEDLNKHLIVAKPEWKGQDLGLNHVAFDESTMPAPGCSCTGSFQQCYKWGKGGWQSACCTTTLSMYPLPVLPNKRHARLGGRKMSGSAFNKLLSRLAAEGHDLSMPLDLKDHWAKHGTNRYITIK
ncbi:hypothetical protein Scep_000436 [Stephania cephalantha]|uniref:GAGA-binding transcriptional activator n=1 Tax=Stephania cephalantha TaxID=152367 RepID=A0AAP0L753_9MAGN